MSDKTPSFQRRYDLDWLRVFAILVVFIFHSMRFFDTYLWHVKSVTVHAPATALFFFFAFWMMPLIFVISGGSLFYDTGRKGFVLFIKDKILRLMIPFVLGVFTHVSFAVYLERTTQGQFAGSFFTFYPHYFEGMYGAGGNFAWSGLHLWYLLFLFIFTLLLLPLFYFLKGLARNFLNKFGNVLAFPGSIFVLICLIASLFQVILDPSSLLGMRAFGGWQLPVYFFYLFFGFMIYSNTRLLLHLQKSWLIYLLIGIAASAIFFWQFTFTSVLPPVETKAMALFGALYIISPPSFILAFIGFACKHLTNSKPFLNYLNEAVLPFYIMHQTVILIIGYYVLQWQLPDLLKWIIIAVLSFISVVLLYIFLVRRFNILRFLFGMRLITKQRNSI